MDWIEGEGITTSRQKAESQRENWVREAKTTTETLIIVEQNEKKRTGCVGYKTCKKAETWHVVVGVE
eukprot:764129-Hanusia_phi.AAC.1